MKLINELLNIDLPNIAKQFKSKEVIGGVVKAPIVIRLDGVRFGKKLVAFNKPRDVRVHRALIESSESILVGEGVIYLEASYEETLLDYAWLGLPLLSTVIALSGIPNKRKMLKLGVPVLVIQVIPTYYAYEILRLHPIWFTLISGVILLTITRLVSKESFDICLSHIIVITTLCIASMITSNPVVLLLGGIGSGLFRWCS